MKLIHPALVAKAYESPLAWGRGLKQSLGDQDLVVGRRPSRGGVD